MILRGDHLPRIFGTDAPAIALVSDACRAAGFELLPSLWEAERDLCRSLTSSEYIAHNRAGAMLRLDRLARIRLWQIANDLRDTPNPGTLHDFRRLSADERSL